MFGLLFAVCAAPILAVAVALLCARRWQRVVPIVVAGFIVYECHAAFMFAAEVTQLCMSSPVLVADIMTSGKPRGERLLVLRDWSVGFAGSPSQFLVYDDTGELRTSGNDSASPMPQSFEVFSETNARLCVGRSEHYIWRFYICEI